MTIKRAVRIGSKVRTRDRQHSGKVLAIRNYTGIGDKLLVQLQAPHYGTLLLAVELWEKF